ncbi:MAG TPA: DUF3592 domain-containing protein [Chthoniobacteraceae bacterium]|jgi:hypothetical protein|nr:DUF3592 domain-containing protein [Chthoniobacteraceae bacterium]
MNSPDTYVPGYRKAKALMAIAGIALFLFGASQLWRPLLLVCRGRRATAEAVSVIKTKQGLPPITLTSDAQIAALREPNDRSYVFWNVFSFTTDTGRVVRVRANIGSNGGPIYPLTDDDGLPTTALIYYDPAHPEHVIFPLLFSTWLVPSALALAGLVAAGIGGILFYWAGTPIVLPHLPLTNKPPNHSSHD